MMKIDVATLKQEKAMKEKSASLQISNLKQKLAGTQRVLEDLKVPAMLFTVAVVFRRKSMILSVGLLIGLSIRWFPIILYRHQTVAVVSKLPAFGIGGGTYQHQDCQS